MVFYKAFKPGTCALRERPGMTPLVGYVGKGQLFEYIEGTPLPVSFAREWIVEIDHEGKAIEIGPAPERKAEAKPATEAAVADRMAALRAKRKYVKKPKAANASEPVTAEG